MCVIAGVRKAGKWFKQGLPFHVTPEVSIHLDNISQVSPFSAPGWMLSILYLLSQLILTTVAGACHTEDKAEDAQVDSSPLTPESALLDFTPWCHLCE